MFFAAFLIVSIDKHMAFRFEWKQSNAPALIRFSAASFFSGTRINSSSIELNSPFLRSVMISSADAPTDFTAPSPNRISFSEIVVNLVSERFTLGGRIFTSSFFASCISPGIPSLSDQFMAAIRNSAG